MTEFQKFIIDAREKSGLSQIDFAKEIGVSSATVAGWETGNKKPRIQSVLKLSNYTGVSYEEIHSMVKGTPFTVDESEENDVADKIYRDGITSYVEHMNFFGLKSVFAYCEKISKDPRFLNKDSRK